MSIGLAPILLVMLAPMAAAGTDPPAFESASVKLAPPGAPYGGVRGGPGTNSPGQIIYEAATLRAVTAIAYGVQRFQIAGPPWFDQQRYDITAKIPPQTTTQQFQLMLQKLLADRFKLELSREERTMVIYEITAAKTGRKMTASPADGSTPSGSGFSEKTSEGKVELFGQRVTMRQLVVWLSQHTDRPIVDKTGLTERYDFSIPGLSENDFTIEEAPPEAAGAGAAADPTGVSIYTALQRYLGLSLVPRKEPVDALVITRLERVPSEN